MIDEHSVLPVCHIKRNTLVSGFACCTTVFVPGVDNLPVFDVRSKPLAEPVHEFTYAEGKFGNGIDSSVCMLHA